MSPPVRLVDDMIQEPTTGNKRHSEDVIDDLEIAPNEEEHAPTVTIDEATRQHIRDASLDDFEACEDTSFATLDGDADSVFSSVDNSPADDTLMEKEVPPIHISQASSLRKQVQQPQLTPRSSKPPNSTHLDDNPFAEVIAKNQSKQKHKTTLLEKLKVHKALNNGASTIDMTTDTNAHTPPGRRANTEGMEVNTPLASDPLTDHASHNHTSGKTDGNPNSTTNTESQQNQAYEDTAPSPPEEAVKAFFNQKKHLTVDRDSTPKDKPKKVTINEPSDGEFVEVKKPKDQRPKQVTDSQRPMVGIRVHKIGGSDIKQEKLNDLVRLLELIEAIDDTAILLPHNKDETKAVKIVDMHLLQASKLRDFFDYIAEPWGAVLEQWFRITVRFNL